MKPKVICMCGSTRFGDLMAALSWEMEKTGIIVLRVNYVPDWYAVEMKYKENAHIADQEGLKEILDELHFRKIDLCDEVYVCNQNDYIGESTSNEIRYALKVGKPIRYATKDETDFKIIFDKLSNWWKKF